MHTAPALRASPLPSAWQALSPKIAVHSAVTLDTLRRALGPGKHLGAPSAVLATGLMGSSETAPFSMAVPNQSVFVGTSIFLQGVTVTGAAMDLRLTDVLPARVR